MNNNYAINYKETLNNAIDLSHPYKLSPVRVWRTYTGGKLIGKLHGEDNPVDNHYPEEWIMSIVEAVSADKGAEKEGLSILEGYGITLKELIEASPQETLGRKHYESKKAQTGVLVKLIDSAERLTIQVHPDKVAARCFFNSDYGKTECWHIIGGRSINGENPSVYIGFKPNITREYWEKIFAEQNIAEMLNCLHRFAVKKGDTFLIKGGVPHAIGSGCLLVEIQEPTDLTLRTERRTPAGCDVPDYMCHQGIGFDNMFECFHYEGAPIEEVGRCKIAPKIIADSHAHREIELVGYSDTPYFRMRKLEVFTSYKFSVNDLFAGLYILSGKGKIISQGFSQAVQKAEQYFIPASAKDFIIENTINEPLVLLICNGPET